MAALKRDPTGSSWSHLEKSDAIGEPPRSSILMIGYPIKVVVFDIPKIGGFLEQCYYCKKRMGQHKEVFMYGNLCAFCSAECREAQIAIDRAAEKQRLKSKKKVVHGQGVSI